MNYFTTNELSRKYQFLGQRVGYMGNPKQHCPCCLIFSNEVSAAEDIQVRQYDENSTLEKGKKIMSKLQENKQPEGLRILCKRTRGHHDVMM